MCCNTELNRSTSVKIRRLNWQKIKSLFYGNLIYSQHYIITVSKCEKELTRDAQASKYLAVLRFNQEEAPFLGESIL